MKTTKLFTITLMSFVFLFGCGKGFDLKRDAPNDAKQNTKNTLYEYIDCSDLSGFGGTAGWQVQAGYSGNGFYFPNSSSPAIDFNRNLDHDVIMNFWTKSVNPGFQNKMPEVLVDGQPINVALIDGSEEYGNWMKLQTATITKGVRNIAISFPYSSTYYSFYIDEINLMR